MAKVQTKTMCPERPRPARAYTTSHLPSSWPPPRHPLRIERQSSSCYRQSTSEHISTISAGESNAHIRYTLAFYLQQESRTSMAPPQLSRHTPILHILHPPYPFPRRRLWSDLQLACSRTLKGLSAGRAGLSALDILLMLPPPSAYS